MSDPLHSSSEIELKSQIERALSEHYELDREIGRGGMGIVWRGVDRRLKRPVAIKILPPELGFRSEVRTRFLREAETAAQLSHPNIVPIYAVDERDKLVFFVMACIEGMNIAQRLQARGPFSASETRRVLHDVAGALDYAHARGVIHRDIKPDNIIIDAESGRAMVTDFGIARAVTDADSRLTATGIAIGTPAFMSPEQSLGDRDIDGRSDLYSLGVVGYQMLCGELPFSAMNTPAMLLKHISETPRPIRERCAEVPAHLAESIMRVLEKNPDDRFPSALVFAAALNGEKQPARESATVRRGAAPSARGTVPAGNALPRAAAGVQLTAEEGYEPSDEELQRWNAPKVLAFRRMIGFFVPVNLVILIFAIFVGDNLLFFSMIWSIVLAFKYAGLWSDGYDWRDIFRHPRHSTLLEVASTAIDDVGSLADPEKRRALRARGREKRLHSKSRPDSEIPARAGEGAASNAARRGAHPGNAARQPQEGRQTSIATAAESDRDDIVRIVASFPRKDRTKLKGVVDSAHALVNRLHALASTPSYDAVREAESRAIVEKEISRLEADANPFDSSGTEIRLRRLAYLKRQRRELQDDTQTARDADRMREECSIALRNMRIDLARLKAGSQTLAHMTQLSQRALSLTVDMDNAVFAASDAGTAGDAARTNGRRGRDVD